MTLKSFSIYAIIQLCFYIHLFAQSNVLSQINQKNTSPEKKVFLSQWTHPKKASMLSAIIPGAGQVYNKKYWKVPIIYAVSGVLIYNVIYQNKKYLYFKTELLKVLNGGINADGYSSEQLILLKNQSKRWRDLSIAATTVTYALNIIDASVDAHLKNFDISDDLSLQIRPTISPFYINSDFQLNNIQYKVVVLLKFRNIDITANKTKNNKHLFFL